MANHYSIQNFLSCTHNALKNTSQVLSEQSLNLYFYKYIQKFTDQIEIDIICGFSYHSGLGYFECGVTIDLS